MNIPVLNAEAPSRSILPTLKFNHSRSDLEAGAQDLASVRKPEAEAPTLRACIAACIEATIPYGIPVGPIQHGTLGLPCARL